MSLRIVGETHRERIKLLKIKQPKNQQLIIKSTPICLLILLGLPIY